MDTPYLAQSTGISLYRVLGVTREASSEEIRKAYKKLARKYHPENDSTLEKKFEEINYAHSVLRDENKRKIYNHYGSTGLDLAEIFGEDFVIKLLSVTGWRRGLFICCGFLTGFYFCCFCYLCFCCFFCNYCCGKFKPGKKECSHSELDAEDGVCSNCGFLTTLDSPINSQPKDKEMHNIFKSVETSKQPTKMEETKKQQVNIYDGGESVDVEDLEETKF